MKIIIRNVTEHYAIEHFFWGNNIYRICCSKLHLHAKRLETTEIPVLLTWSNGDAVESIRNGMAYRDMHRFAASSLDALCDLSRTPTCRPLRQPIEINVYGECSRW